MSQPLKQTDQLILNLLKKKSLRFLKRKQQTNFGELDYLAVDGQILVIIELRLLKVSNQVSSIEMIGFSRMQQLALIVNQINSQSAYQGVRVDLVTVDSPKVHYHKGIMALNC